MASSSPHSLNLSNPSIIVDLIKSLRTVDQQSYLIIVLAFGTSHIDKHAT